MPSTPPPGGPSSDEPPSAATASDTGHHRAHPRLLLVAAVAENGVIGRDNALPWRLPDDLKRFKALTLGKPILMGRKTWSSLGRPLPGRTNLVLTRDREFAATAGAHGAIAVHSLAEALAHCAHAAELAIIGGAEVFQLTLPLADRIELTRVAASVAGDVRFPELEPSEWRLVAREAHPADAHHAHAMFFETLERIGRHATLRGPSDLPSA